MDVNNINYLVTRPDGSAIYGRPSTDASVEEVNVIAQLNGNGAENPYEIAWDSAHRYFEVGTVPARLM